MVICAGGARFAYRGWNASRPESWSDSIRAIEEVVETLIILNLTEVTGLPLTFIRKAWAIDPTVDVVAADQLGRIHIFELKKASIGAQAASQLEHYLLRHVFQDADERIREWAEVGRKQVARGYLARLIMGAHACDRSSIAGLKKVLGELGETHPSAIGENGKRLSRVKWAKVDEVEKIRRLHPAVERFAIRKGIGTIPPWILRCVRASVPLLGELLFRLWLSHCDAAG